MQNLPTFKSYGNYSSANYGAHALVFSQGGNDFYFSYNTLVAFTDPASGRRIVRENIWGPTTGKHLNKIDGGSAEAKAERLSSEEFKTAHDACYQQGVVIPGLVRKKLDAENAELASIRGAPLENA
jgi:hypothetical protein